MRRVAGRAFDELMAAAEKGPMSQVSSEIERRRVVVKLDAALDALRALRGEESFWLELGPGYRVRYEDFHCDLVVLLAKYRHRVPG